MISQPKEKSYLVNRWAKLAVVFVAILVAYSLARLEFVWWNWPQLQARGLSDLGLAFLHGFRFDLAAAAMHVALAVILTLVPWPRAWEKAWGYAVALIVSVPLMMLLWINLIDVEFVNFAGRRFTSETLFILSEAQGKISGFLSNYWLLFLINTPLGLLSGYVVWKVINKPSTSGSAGYLKHLGISLLALSITVVAGRGGLQKKPISFANANVFTSTLLNQVVLNSTFTIAKSLSTDSLPRAHYFSDRQEMLSLLNHSEGAERVPMPQLPQKQNVVIIVLESFALEYMGRPNGDQGWTPFLDELSERSLFYRGWANGRRSIEGLAAVMASIPALMSEPFISSGFSSNEFFGLGTVLNREGYHTSFFHGAGNGTMFFDSFMKSAGVDRYFGENEYPSKDDHDGKWGIFDEPFLKFFSNELNGFPQPFFSTVFTLSSHHPYKIPDDKKNMFPDGPIEILASVSYADWALRQFFKHAERQAWYENTLFVLTADHTQKHYRPSYENTLGDFKIPILLFHPQGLLPKLDTTESISQIDLYPTILDFLGLPNDHVVHLGRSAFRPGPRTVVQYLDQSYVAIREPYWMQWSPNQASKLFMTDDPSGKREVKDAQVSNDLERRLKAQIQYYSEGMWDNRLHYSLKK